MQVLRKFYPVAFLVFVIAALPHTDGHARDSLRVSSVEGSSDANAGEAVLREAYKRLGIDIVIERMQGRKALEASNSGEVDGEVQRIDGITRSFKNLLQIPIPINYLEGTVFSKRYNFPIQGWFSLEPYRVGIVKGILFAERGTKGMDVRVADDYPELVGMLENDEIDVAVMPRINGRVALKQSDAKDIRELDGVLETLMLYHYLHRKHEHLVPKLTKQLKEILLDGATLKLRTAIYKKLLEDN